MKIGSDDNEKNVCVAALSAALILCGCTALHDVPISELEPGQKVVIKQPDGKLEGKVWSVDEDTVVVSQGDDENRKKTEIDLTDEELEIKVREFSWAKTLALIVGASPVIAVAVVVLLSFIIYN